MVEKDTAVAFSSQLWKDNGCIVLSSVLMLLRLTYLACSHR
jgi:hypothetical protein